MRISENQLKRIIESVIMENRKVLKIGNSEPSPAPMPDMSGQDASMNMDPMMGQTGEMGGPGNPGVPADPGMGADANGDMKGQFDTNFDAGVEADEETDPKRYIQQLTGKLSQSINSFMSEQGPDEGLAKYVASMIIAATCKNMDEKAKKEMIEKINTTDSAEDDETDMAGEDEGGQDMPPMDDLRSQEQPPVNEKVLSKRELQEIAAAHSMLDREEGKDDTKQEKQKIPSIFGGKKY